MKLENDALDAVDNIAYAIDRLRMMPRFLIGMYGWLFYETAMWFMDLPAPNNAQSAFVSVIVGAGAGFFGLYVAGKPTLIRPYQKPDPITFDEDK